MHNPNVSAEAKEHSRQIVEELQGPGAVPDDYSREPSGQDATGDKEESRVIGGYKAALKSKSFTIMPRTVTMTRPTSRSERRRRGQRKGSTDPRRQECVVKSSLS